MSEKNRTLWLRPGSLSLLGFTTIASRIIRYPLRIGFSLLLMTTLPACSSGGGGGVPGGSDVDTTAPTATITFPTATSLTEADSVTVHGRASDAGSEITVVRVNGIDATSSDNFANWQAVVPLNLGDNTLTVETGDMALNSNANAAQVEIDSSFFISPQGLVLDSSNNRLLVMDRALNALLAIDLTTGARTVISDSTTPDNVNALLASANLVLDSDNNRVLVVDSVLDAVFAVDLTPGINMGARMVVSDNSTPDGVNAFVVPSDLVLDSSNNRLLVVDLGLNAVLAVDLTPGINMGARTVISDSTTPDDINAFSQPRSLVLDSANNRLLVVDGVLSALLAVDLTPGINMGARTIISDVDTPNNSNWFISPRHLVLDSANNRVMVLDATRRAVVAVDLTTGERTIVSDSTIPNDVNTLTNPKNLLLDSANNRLLVTLGENGVISVDLTPGINSGARTVIVDNTTPDNLVSFSEPRSVVLDSANNRALVVDSGANAVFAIDLTTGARTVISDSTTPDDVNDMREPVRLALDSANNQLLVLNHIRGSGEATVLGVDLTPGINMGARTVISDSTTPDGTNAFFSPTSLALDSANNRVFVTDPGLRAVLEVDLTPGINMGARTIISDRTTPDSVNRFINPQSLVLDSANNRVLVADAKSGAVLAVDLTPGTNRGARTIISDRTTPDNVNTFGWLVHLVLDSANNRLLAVDSNRNAVLAVDLSPGINRGARTIISDELTPGDVNLFNAPISMALDDSNDRVLVLDEDLAAIIAVQVDSGERLFLSKSNLAAPIPDPKGD